MKVLIYICKRDRERAEREIVPVGTIDSYLIGPRGRGATAATVATAPSSGRSSQEQQTCQLPMRDKLPETGYRRLGFNVASTKSANGAAYLQH